MIKTSVIIPVYNTAEYLEECVDSVIAQTQEGVEIILVDDGSTDGSLEMCEKYAASYDNITLIRQEHEFQGTARNRGLRASEALFFDHGRQYGTDICVVRIFNTYGPNMSPNDGRVIPNFVTQALSGDDITVYGNGTQTRSFCYITDLLAGLEAAMAKKDFRGPVNLGNPSEMTVKHLAELVIQLTGSSSKIVYRNLPADDPSRRRPDISLAERELGWTPVVGAGDGLGMTIDYYRKKIQNDQQ